MAQNMFLRVHLMSPKCEDPVVDELCPARGYRLIWKRISLKRKESSTYSADLVDGRIVLEKISYLDCNDSEIHFVTESKGICCLTLTLTASRQDVPFRFLPIRNVAAMRCSALILIQASSAARCSGMVARPKIYPPRRKPG